MSTGDRIWTLTLATAALAAMSGCGGGAATPTSTTPSTPAARVVSIPASPGRAATTAAVPTSTDAATAAAAPTAGEFRAQANAVCRHQDQVALSMLLGGARQRHWVTRAAATQEAERELAALTAPSALSGAWTQVRADRAIVAGDLLPAQGAGTQRARANAAQLRQARADLLRVARVAGLADCAKVV